MEPFLENGELAGKIVCPNSRCGAKLGNYDWAGVRCSCKEWVTPVSACSLTSLSSCELVEWRSSLARPIQGFCIHRSKVDEIVV